MVLLPLSKKVLAANIVLPILATIAVVLRFAARKTTRSSLKADDYVILLALVIAIGISSSGIYAAVINIFAEPIPKMTPQRYSLHEKLIWSDVLLCHIVYGVIKISILLFYNRIFATRRFHLVTNIFLGVVACWMVAAAFGHIFSADPVDKWWTSPPGWQTAINYELYLTVMAALDIALDTFTLMLPLPMIRKLNMSTRKKVSLIAIFMLGFFCVVSSAIRLYYCWRLYLVVHHKISPSNITSISAWNDVWAHIEACASITTACLPSMAPLLKEIDIASSLFTRLGSKINSRSRSIFSLHRSSRNQSREKQESIDTFDSNKHQWYELERSKSLGSSRPVVTDRLSLDEEALIQSQKSVTTSAEVAREP